VGAVTEVGAVAGAGTLAPAGRQGRSGDRVASPRVPPMAQSVPLPLDFEDEAERPVAYALTPRARRAVSPERVPELALVPTGESVGSTEQAPGETTEVISTWFPESVLEDSDTRPAQARALRRSGMPPATIAAALGVDRVLVDAWTDGTVPAVRTRPTPASRPTSRPHVLASSPASAIDPVVPDAPAHGRTDARALSTFDAGLLAGLAAIDEQVGTLTLRHADPTLVAVALAFLRDHLSLSDVRIRVVVRHGVGRAGDRVRTEIATGLDVPIERVVSVRWQGAPASDAIETIVVVNEADAVRFARSSIARARRGQVASAGPGSARDAAVS